MSEKINWKINLICMMSFALMIAPLKLTWNSQIRQNLMIMLSKMFKNAGKTFLHFTKEFTIT